jgi:hypothetical protein
MQALIDMCQRSHSEKKGITFFIPGQSVAMVVTEVHGAEFVEGYNQTFGKIVLRLDAVVAAAEG